jgi:phosphoribosylformylglycinamidine synthase
MIQADVTVMPKDSVLDPQGSAVEHSLHALGFGEVGAVRIGRRISLQLTSDDMDVAQTRVSEMCNALLANGVIEQYSFNLSHADLAVGV